MLNPGEIDHIFDITISLVPKRAEGLDQFSNLSPSSPNFLFG